MCKLRPFIITMVASEFSRETHIEGVFGDDKAILDPFELFTAAFNQKYGNEREYFAPK